MTTETQNPVDSVTNSIGGLIFHSSAIANSPLRDTFIGKAAMSILGLQSTAMVAKSSMDAVGGMFGVRSDDLIERGKNYLSSPEAKEKLNEFTSNAKEKLGGGLNGAVEFLKSFIADNKESLSKIPGIQSLLEPALEQMEKFNSASQVGQDSKIVATDALVRSTPATTAISQQAADAARSRN